MGQPDLLFLMTDHQRADSIGMAQAGREVTPNLNRLASRGASFTRAYTTCPLCVPARTALATGIYPTRTGVVFNDWRGSSAGDWTTLHECLSGAGYDVAHIGVDHIRVDPPLRERVPFVPHGGDYGAYAEEHGLGVDPAPFRREITELQGGERRSVLYSNTRTAVWPHPAGEFKDCFWAEQAVSSLRQRRDRPLAVFLYLWAPHPPLWVPEPYASMFPPDALELPLNVNVPAEGEPTNRRLGIAAQLAEGLTMDDWRLVWAAHLGLVRLADDALGRVLEAVPDPGNALTFFTVDHGDHLGQHRMYQKMEMYEQAVRVPLLLAGPGIAAGTFDTPVSHLDVMPTLLELLGIEAPGGLDGRSLAESLRTRVEPEERPVFSQYSGNPTVGDLRRAVITRTHKYVCDPRGEAELYDLRNDPLEMRNLAAGAENADIVRELHALCRAWGESHGDWVTF